MVRLDEAATVKGMQLRNRLVLAPITTGHATPDGEVTDQHIGFYKQRSRDVGMVVAEASVIRPDGRLLPRSLGLWDDAKIAGMKRLAQAIKGEGAVAVVQIAHAGARSVPQDQGVLRASPSNVVIAPGPAPTELTQEQIGEIVEDFVSAAARAAEAGFDGVEIHGAHHYFISEFLSPIINQREDRYGGDAARRTALALEVVRGMRKRLGQSYLIQIRLDAVEIIEGGKSIEEGAAQARLLESAGVDVIHSSLIAQAFWKESSDGQRFLQSTSALSKDQPMGNAVPYAARIKAAVGVPVIAVGKLGNADVAARAVEDGSVDLVAVGRQMIADPDTVRKILSSRGNEIVQCQECNACFASIRRDSGLQCSVNKNTSGPAEY